MPCQLPCNYCCKVHAAAVDTCCLPGALVQLCISCCSRWLQLIYDNFLLFLLCAASASGLVWLCVK
jgi:hypothetical protein